MRLTFTGDEVRRIAERSAEAPLDELRPLFHQQTEAFDGKTWADTPERGLWLVGDQGVYIMSNAPFPQEEGSRKQVVCYAKECDPTHMPFDDWWEAKQASFGPDDGGDFIPLERLIPLSNLEGLSVELTPKQFTVTPIRNED